MASYFLGADVGGTKTHLAIANETGQVIGFGESGPGNHESVGFEGTYHALSTALEQALAGTGLSPRDITRSAFGMAGYDWPCHVAPLNEVINRLGLATPHTLVNDAIPGLVAGAKAGWGVVVISGTGCNCRGWDREHKREGRVTGFGVLMGEAAGASELVFRAMQLVGYSWGKRLPPTALSDLFIKHVGARDLDDLLEGYTENKYHISPGIAPEMFQIARQGDAVALDLARWAGCQLGEMAIGVIHQLEFETLEFEVVLSGSMFEAGDLLIHPMRTTIQACAPGAQLVRLAVFPVIGSILISMMDSGHDPTPALREMLSKTLSEVLFSRKGVNHGNRIFSHS